MSHRNLNRCGSAWSICLALLAALVLTGPGCAAAMGARSGSAPADASNPEQGAPGADAPARFVPGEVLVRFRADVNEAQRDTVLARLEMRVTRSLGGQNAYVVALPAGMSVPDAMERLRALPEVEAAEPNRITPREPMPGARPAPYRPQ